MPSSGVVHIRGQNLSRVGVFFRWPDSLENGLQFTLALIRFVPEPAVTSNHLVMLTSRKTIRLRSNSSVAALGFGNCALFRALAPGRTHTLRTYSCVRAQLFQIRPETMNQVRICKPVAALMLLLAPQLFAQLPSQTRLEPASGDYGATSFQDTVLGLLDPESATAYDNFSLDAPYDITGLKWSGIYSEPLPTGNSNSDTDFVVRIYEDSERLPDLSRPLLSWLIEGGSVPGIGGGDLSVVANGLVSPPSDFVIGGGPGYDYEASLTGQLPAGDYWISIVADQLFGNDLPIVDPVWMWHFGEGPGNGYAMEDKFLEIPLGLMDGQDLAFEIQGILVPEPTASSIVFMMLIPCMASRHRRSF